MPPGMWAVLAWLQILASKTSAAGKLVEAKAFISPEGLYDCSWNEMNQNQLATASADGSADEQGDDGALVLRMCWGLCCERGLPHQPPTPANSSLGSGTACGSGATGESSTTICSGVSRTGSSSADSSRTIAGLVSERLSPAGLVSGVQGPGPRS